MNKIKMPHDEKYLSFIDHLEELRYRLVIICSALIIFSIVGYFVSIPVIDFLLKPLAKAQTKEDEKRITFIADKNGNLRLKESLPKDTDKLKYSSSQFEVIDETHHERKYVFGSDYRKHFYYFSPMTPMILQFEAAFFISALISLPIIIFQLWRFITPALTAKEKKAAFLIIIAALILFPTGAAFAYYVLQYALYFLLSYSFSGLEPRLDVMKYLSFAIKMMLAMGAVFEFPIVAMFLGKLGIIKSKMMKKYRRYSIVLIVIFSAVITPSPDPISMIVVAIPLFILYELSIYLVQIVEKKSDGTAPINEDKPNNDDTPKSALAG